MVNILELLESAGGSYLNQVHVHVLYVCVCVCVVTYMYNVYNKVLCSACDSNAVT